jgi:hypothetical protein
MRNTCEDLVETAQGKNCLGGIGVAANDIRMDLKIKR